jgi:hypothetical protein
VAAATSADDDDLGSLSLGLLEAEVARERAAAGVATKRPGCKKTYDSDTLLADSKSMRPGKKLH